MYVIWDSVITAGRFSCIGFTSFGNEWWTLPCSIVHWITNYFPNSTGISPKYLNNSTWGFQYNVQIISSKSSTVLEWPFEIILKKSQWKLLKSGLDIECFLSAFIISMNNLVPCLDIPRYALLKRFYLFAIFKYNWQQQKNEIILNLLPFFYVSWTSDTGFLGKSMQ